MMIFPITFDWIEIVEWKIELLQLADGIFQHSGYGERPYVHPHLSMEIVANRPPLWKGDV